MGILVRIPPKLLLFARGKRRTGNKSRWHLGADEPLLRATQKIYVKERSHFAPNEGFTGLVAREASNLLLWNEQDDSRK